MTTLAADPATRIDPSVWGSQRKACRIAGTSPYQFQKLVALGRVRALAVPGVSTKYNLDDVAAVAAEYNASRSATAA